MSSCSGTAQARLTHVIMPDGPETWQGEAVARRLARRLVLLLALLVLDALRLEGEFLARAEMSKGGRPTKTTAQREAVSSLKSQGISFKESVLAQLVALMASGTAGRKKPDALRKRRASQ